MIIIILRAIAVALVCVAAIPATAGPIYYGLTRPWRSTAGGRAILYLWAGLGALIDLSILFFALHALSADPPRILLGVVQVLVDGYIAVTVWRLFLVMFSASEQREQRRRRVPRRSRARDPQP